MPGIVHRYQTASQFDEMFSTKPSPRHRRNAGASPALLDEASAWVDALRPSLADTRTAVARARALPDCTQQSVFAYLTPLYAFLFVVILAAVALQPHSFVNRFLDAPRIYAAQAAKYAGALVMLFLAGLAVLRIIIWGVAELCAMLVESQRAAERDSRSSVEVLQDLSAKDVWLGAVLS